MKKIKASSINNKQTGNILQNLHSGILNELDLKFDLSNSKIPNYSDFQAPNLTQKKYTRKIRNTDKTKVEEKHLFKLIEQDTYFEIKKNIDEVLSLPLYHYHNLDYSINFHNLLQMILPGMSDLGIKA
ncbi:hypothetical protein COBT_002098, partial [Conglomerata obtusa]